MNNRNETTVSRRVVLDAESLGYSKPASAGGRNNSKRPRRKQRRKTTDHKQTEDRQLPDNNPDHTPIPIELQPVIKAAVSYGRKTHALGAMKAASALLTIVERLKAFEFSTPGISDIVNDAETEASSIQTMLSESYEA